MIGSILIIRKYPQDIVSTYAERISGSWSEIISLLLKNGRRYGGEEAISHDYYKEAEK
jgi:hypothetical protein